jgi:hypothetical protein
MLRSIILASVIMSSSAFAQSVLDLSRPQTEGFNSIVDLRGDPNLKPQDANPQQKVEAPPISAAVLPAALASTEVDRNAAGFGYTLGHSGRRVGTYRPYIDLHSTSDQKPWT